MKTLAVNQNQPNANELWSYFQSVINWVEILFTTYRKEMKGVDWGGLYNNFKDYQYDSNQIENQIAKLMENEDVTKKSGVYSFILTKKEKHLNIRAFSPKQRREAYERQSGICPVCNNSFELSEMDADHITPWHIGGKTSSKNCQMLCKDDNRRKSGR